jgi:enoyl-[acyl-carrier protein] reductase III
VIEPARNAVLVTGGTRGIGRAISLALARVGYAVVAVYARDHESARSLVEDAKLEGLSLQTFRADIRRKEHVGSLIEMIREQFPTIRAIIHSAASGVHRPVDQLTSKHLLWTIETNVIAIHDLIRELLPLMKEGGRIIGITSFGSTRVLPFYAAVGASKGAMDALFRHYARELAPRGIAVNLICPGLIVTDGSAALPDMDGRKEAVLQKTPTGRLTTPEDVATIAVFLCGAAASQILGQTIVVDGGYSLS